MTYALIDDKTFRNKALRSCGAQAALLYAVALIECAADDGDGVLDDLTVKDAAGMYDLPRYKALAARLVEAGLWHGFEGLKGCAICLDRTPSIDEGALLIHEWWEPLLPKDGKKDPIKRERELRRKRIWRNKTMVGAIRRRDEDRCRYCAVRCTDPADPDKLAATRLTLDHIDPFGPDDATNLVVACRRCNGRKRDRTPEEAGMRLLDPGTRPDTKPTPTRHTRTAEPAPDQTHVGDARETGPGRHGPGLDGPGTGHWPGPEPTPAHSTNGNGAHA